jgi:hypothetical protein
MTTPEVHKIPAHCSALCKCANWLCQTFTPHHTIAGRSSVSLTQSPFTFPSNCRWGPSLTSYMPGRAVPSRAWHSSTHHRTLFTVHGLCTYGLHVEYTITKLSSLCFPMGAVTSLMNTEALKLFLCCLPSHMQLILKL